MPAWRSFLPPGLQVLSTEEGSHPDEAYVTFQVGVCWVGVCWVGRSVLDRGVVGRGVLGGSECAG